MNGCGPIPCLQVARRGFCRHPDCLVTAPRMSACSSMCYRRGLAIRYAKAMQLYAGIHYNFSPAAPLWACFRAGEVIRARRRTFSQSAYMDLIANFRRYAAADVVLLVPSRPLIARPSFKGVITSCCRWASKRPVPAHATSLRMSDLGYKTTPSPGPERLLQQPRTVHRPACRSDSACRTQDLRPSWVRMMPRVNGRQLNTNLLQIENEFYSRFAQARDAQVARSRCTP